MNSDGKLVRVDVAAGEADLVAVRGLMAEFAAEFGPLVAEVFEVQGFHQEVAGLPGRYAPPSGCLLLATVGDFAAGCVALRDLGGGTCEMKRLYVVTAYRNHQVGQRLVAAVIDQAGRAGYSRMVLDTLPEMVAAIALYQRNGFRTIEPYWSHPTARAVFMGLELGGGPGTPQGHE